jgi:hypothetical protein
MIGGEGASGIDLQGKNERSARGQEHPRIIEGKRQHAETSLFAGDIKVENTVRLDPP